MVCGGGGWKRRGVGGGGGGGAKVVIILTAVKIRIVNIRTVSCVFLMGTFGKR